MTGAGRSSGGGWNRQFPRRRRDFTPEQLEEWFKLLGGWGRRCAGESSGCVTAAQLEYTYYEINSETKQRTTEEPKKVKVCGYHKRPYLLSSRFEIVSERSLTGGDPGRQRR